MREGYIHKVGEKEYPITVEITLSGHEILSKLEPKIAKIAQEAVDKAVDSITKQLAQYNINITTNKV